MRAYYLRIREKYKAYRRRYYDENKEYFLLYRRNLWLKKNPDSIILRRLNKSLLSWLKIKEREREQQRIYGQKNRSALLASKRAWSRNHRRPYVYQSRQGKGAPPAYWRRKYGDWAEAAKSRHALNKILKERLPNFTQLLDREHSRRYRIKKKLREHNFVPLNPEEGK